MDEIKEAHFATLSRNAAHYKGRILKNTGDGVLAIFRTTPPAVQFALSSARAPGHDEVRIRAGIHVGRVKPKDNDIFGQTVNFAARVQSSLLDSGVILSDDAKRDLERIHGKKQEFFGFKIREEQELKGFDGKYTLWLIERYSEGYLESVR
jgi:class 3 adenylate cyclase